MGLPKTFQDLLPPWWGRRAPAAGQGETDDPFLALQREVNQAFANFWRAADVGPLAGVFGGAEPRTDLVETDKAFEVSFDLPGLEEKEVEISLAGQLLTVKAERKQQQEQQQAGRHVAERHYGLIRRSLTLPAPVDAEGAQARFNNGVLTITLPKTAPAEAAAKKIAVQKG